MVAVLLCACSLVVGQVYWCGSPEESPWAVRMHGLGPEAGWPHDCVHYEGEILHLVCDGFDDLEECSKRIRVEDRAEEGIRVVNEATGASHDIAAPPHCRAAKAAREEGSGRPTRAGECPSGYGHGSAWKTFAEFDACPDTIVGFNVSWTCPAPPPHGLSPDIMPMLWWSGLEPYEHDAVLQPQTFWGYLDCDGNGGSFWAIGSALVPTNGLIYISLAYPTTPGNSVTGQIYSTPDGDKTTIWNVVTIDNDSSKVSNLKLSSTSGADGYAYQEAYIVMEAYNGFSTAACEHFYPANQTSITFTDFTLELADQGVLDSFTFTGGSTSGAVCGETTTVSGSTPYTMTATTIFPH